MKLGFIGGGRITRIFLKGFKNAEISLENVIVSDNNQETLDKLKKEFPEIKTVNDNEKSASQDIIFIALHPPAMAEVLPIIKTHLKKDSIMVSLAPKIKIAQIYHMLDGFSNIVRMIPNAPSIINEGYNPLTFSTKMEDELKNKALNLIKVLGDCPLVEEHKLEAYALITAMGPTYFWFQIQQLHKLGRSFGLDEDDLSDGIYHMIKGTTKTYYHSSLKSEEIMDLVPLKPLESEEEDIKTAYQLKLQSLYAKLQ